MTIYWTGGGPGLLSPAAFVEIGSANPPVRPAVGTVVRVRNAKTLVEISSFFDANGAPATQVTTLSMGYLCFGVTDVKAVQVSADNFTTVTTLVMTNAIIEAIDGVATASTDAKAVRYGPAGQQAGRAALAGRLEARAKLVVVGDAAGEGQGAVPNGRRWVTRLQQSLRNAYGLAGGGTGYLPAYYDSSGLTQPFTLDTAVSGATITKDTRYGLGGRSYLLTKGAALVRSEVCTTFVVHYAKDTYGTLLKVIVDGTQIATIDTNGANGGGFVWTSPSLTSGTHQVRLENGDPTVGYGTIVSGVDFRNGDESAGITVFDGSHFGWAATNFTTEHDKSLTAVDPDVIIHAIGSVDATVVTSEQFRINMQSRVARAEAAVTKPHSVILMAYVARADSTVEPWANYVAVLSDIAAGMSNGSLLDLTLRMPRVAGDTLSLYDGVVQLTSRGHALVEDVVFSSLVPGGAGGGAASGAASGGTVTSVNGQVGAVSLDAASIGAAPASHVHSATAITSGTLSVDRAPVGSMIAVVKTGTSWPARPTTRADVIVAWIGAEPSPSIVSSGTTGMYAADARFVI